MKPRTVPRSAPGKRRLLLVDDHAIVREGLAELINGEPDLTVCGQTHSAPKAVDAVERLKPDLAIIDLSLQNGSGLELIRQLRKLHAKLPLLVLSMHDEALYAERCLRAGAQGYVMKSEEARTLLEAIRLLLRGEVFVSRTMGRQLLQQSVGAKSATPRSKLMQLSDREIEIFRMLADGQTTRQIAAQLHVAVCTVETHYAHLKLKLNLGSSVELRRAAVTWFHPG